MTISSISADLLISYYSVKSGVSTAASSSTSSSSTAKAPTAPWNSTTTPSLSSLTSAVLSGQAFINVNAAKLDVTGAADSSDYKNLFALYQGLSALDGLASQAASGSSTSSTSALQSAFARGLSEVQNYLAGSPFKTMVVADGTATAKATSTVSAPEETDTYTTSTIYSGDLNGVVPAFQGDVAFNMTVKKGSGVTTDIAFDLSEMGTTPRTMGNVINYMNGKLADAGVATRFTDVRTAGTQQTITAGGQTIDMGVSPDTYALQIKGAASETLTLSAAQTSPAVYVAQTSGTTSDSSTASTSSTTSASTTTTSDATQQLLKLDGDPDSDGPDRIFGKTLPDGVSAVRATATASDGSLYVLADVTGTTSDGQTVQGAQDVALMKYDSAGNMVYTRTLGAADSASGFALAVSPDGKSVAVAGSVTGALTGTASLDTTSSDSFVSVFDSAGNEEWTARRGAVGADQPTGVTFGADGTVYVSGNASAAMPGAAAVGGQDGYLEAFTATSTSVAGETTYTAKSGGVVQFGTSASDHTVGVVTTSDGGVVTASVENGHAVLRRYASPLTAGAQPTETRDLGSLGGGDLAGVSLADDGSIIVAGSTKSGDLDAGTTTTGYTSGSTAFVAKLSADLTPSTADRLTYLDTGGDATASALTVSNGQVYVTGQVTGAPLAGEDDATHTGYAVAVDPTTGSVSWATSFTGADGQAAPSAIAVDADGTSALDQLGLPTGTISYAVSSNVVADTSARAGDVFYVRNGSGTPQAVTITADDTFQTLATKINRASGFAANAQVVLTDGKYQLQLTPANNSSKVELQAGSTGDALGALGLNEGLITAAGTTSGSKSSAPQYSLQLSSSLNLSTVSDAQAAQKAIEAAMNRLKIAYSALVTPTTSSSTSTSAGLTNAEQTYISNRVANYQLALQRLTGSS